MSITTMAIRFRATYGKGSVLYQPKTRKLAEQIMLLHTNLGDSIEMLEDTDDEGQTSETEEINGNANTLH